MRIYETELHFWRIVMVTIRPFSLDQQAFICEWMGKRPLILGSSQVILLPALCHYFRFAFFDSRKETLSTGEPFSKFIFKFGVGFQHTKFAAETLKHASLNRKE